MRAPGTAPQPAAPTRCGSNLGLRAGSSPAPPAQNKNPKAEGGKAPEAWERENKARPAQLASHNAGPGAAAPPPPALPRTAPAGSSGRRLRSPTGPARPRVRRESARHKAPRAPGGMRGRGAPAAPSRTAPRPTELRGRLAAGPGRAARAVPGEGAAAPVSPRGAHPPHLRAERDGSGGAASPQGPADEKRLTQRRARPPATYIRRAAYPGGRGPANQSAALALVRTPVGPRP